MHPVAMASPATVRIFILTGAPKDRPTPMFLRRMCFWGLLHSLRVRHSKMGMIGEKNSTDGVQAPKNEDRLHGRIAVHRPPYRRW